MSKLKVPTFFYFLSTQFENYGDLVINRECMKLLRKHGKLVVQANYAPEDFLKRLGVSTDEKSGRRFTFARGLIGNALRGKPTYLVLVPGAISGDLTRGQWLRHLGLAATYRSLAILGVRIVRLGASMDPLTKRRAPIERWKSHAMHFIGLRDQLSIDAAARAGLQHTASFPDFAWMLPARDLEVASNKSEIFLSFRASNNLELDDVASAVSEYLAQVDPKKNAALTLVCQVERDRATCRELAQRIQAGREVTYLDVEQGESDLLDAYANAAVVLSNRLHVLLFAARQGAPIRAFVHPDRNQKIIGLFQDSGIGERLVNITQINEIKDIPYPDTPLDPIIFDTHREKIEAQFAAMIEQ